MTQRELADAVGVCRQTIVSIETSDYAPSVYLALRIAGRLHTTVENLFDPQEGGHEELSAPARASRR